MKTKPITDTVNAKKPILRVLKKISNIISWVFLGIVILLIIVVFVTRINGETPSIFGYSIFRVSSASMEPELMVGDVILSKKVTDPSELSVGDVVTYYNPDFFDGLVTHKVSKAPYLEDGVLMIETKGVANDIADPPMPADNIISIMVTKLGFLSVFYNVFLSIWGLLILIALVIWVFFDELIAVIRIITGTDSNKHEDINEIIERLEKEKAAQLQAEKEAQIAVSAEEEYNTAKDAEKQGVRDRNNEAPGLTLDNAARKNSKNRYKKSSRKASPPDRGANK
ncbi:MAG: signal peptidase I [Ruminococcus sp.]